MRVYSMKNNVLLVNGVEIDGFGEGDDVVTFKRLADLASHKMGADGSMAVSVSADNSAEMAVKLSQTSPSNAYFMGLVAGQQNGPSTFVPIAATFQDSYRQDIFAGLPGYIQKTPEVSRGATATEQTWTFVFQSGGMIFGAPAFEGPVALAESFRG